MDKIVGTMREPAEPWVIALNAQYQKVLNILITLSTAAMVLPVFFIRDLLGTPTESYELMRDPSFIGNPVVYWSWFCFSGSIFAGGALLLCIGNTH